LIGELAATPRLTSDQTRAGIHRITGSSSSKNRISKQLITSAKEFKADGQLGRLRAVLLMGTTLDGQDFVKRAEAAGLLLANDGSTKKFSHFLNQLSSECHADPHDAWKPLLRRLETYKNYCDLLQRTALHRSLITRMAQTPVRLWAKQLLALAELCFRWAYFGLKVPPSLEVLFARFDSANDFAAAVATAVALANERRQLDAADLGSAVGNLSASKLLSLIKAGHLTAQIRDFAKHASLFQYEIIAVSADEKRAFVLRPVTQEFEMSVRLAYIRTDVGRNPYMLDLTDEEKQPNITLETFANSFIKRFGSEITEVRDPGTPFRRLRINMPIIPATEKALRSVTLSDEQAELEGLSQDFMIPMRLKDAPELRLTENLSFEEFNRLYRYLRFFSLVNSKLSAPYAATDFTLFCNSLVRIATEEGLVGLLGSSGISRLGVIDFLALISADTSDLGHYDLQYSPLLKFQAVPIPEIPRPEREYLHLPSVLVASSSTRNVQMANQLRLHRDGKLFVTVVAAMLQRHFPSVVTERKIELGNIATEIDVAVLADETLFLFECKHSIAPTDAHEMRDAWRDIQKGVAQLTSADLILADRASRRRFLVGWFPGLDPQQIDTLNIVRCVLSSHRTLSGQAFDGVAVRDYGSLGRLLDYGYVRMGAAIDKKAVFRGFSILRGEKLTKEDLVHYLSTSSIFFRMFRHFMAPLQLFNHFEDTILVRETFVYQVSVSEWCEWMHSEGYKQLEDLVVDIPSSTDIYDLDP
jgi:hypothetical protein